jgi:hypothetical protein
MSDLRLDVVVLLSLAVGAIIGSLLAPPRWQYALVPLATVSAIGSGLQLWRRYTPTDTSMSAVMFSTRHEGLIRDELIRTHFAVQPEIYTVSCNYCPWSTTQYDRRLVLAPQHLHDAHPRHDPRIPRWLRSPVTAWVGRRITYA